MAVLSPRQKPNPFRHYNEVVSKTGSIIVFHRVEELLAIKQPAFNISIDIQFLTFLSAKIAVFHFYLLLYLS